MADRDVATERSSEEIRREIERTRSDLDRTVEAIGDKFSPGRILDEIWTRANSAEGRAALAHSVREHPVPLALMGVGLGWLALDQLRGSHDGVGEGTYGRAEGRVGPYRGDAVNRDDPDWEYASVGTRLKAKASEAAHAVGEVAGSLKEKVAGARGAAEEKLGAARESSEEAAGSARESVHHAAERGREAAHRAGERVSSVAQGAARRARRSADRAGERMDTMLEESPLTLGALAFGLGMAAGMSLPSTSWEDRTLGRYSGPLKNEAKRAMRDTAHKVESVARDAAGVAREQIARESEEMLESESFQEVVSRIETSARDVGRTVKEKTLERAREEELTPEGLRQAGRRIRDRAGEPAED